MRTRTHPGSGQRGPVRRWFALLACLLALATLPWLTGCRAAPGGTAGGTTGGSGSASGATAAGAIPVGRSDGALDVDGRRRTYHLYRPAGLRGPAPLVVMLHGGFGSGEQAERSYGWDGEADRGHFVVAYPDGQSRAWNVGGGCCGKPGQDGVDDVAFIERLVARVRAGIPIDGHRVFATGISNGGMLSYRLACDSTLFAAIGPDSATMLGSCPHPAPLSVIHIHGTADRNIPYLGGPGSGVARIDGPAVPTVVATWRRVDECGTPQPRTSGAVTTSTAACPDGRAVQLITISGAGHQWPGAPQRPVLEKVLGTDRPSTALNATDVVWQFFAAHPGR